MWQFIDGVWRIKATIKHEHYIYDICFNKYNWMLAVTSGNSTDILEVINACK
jgi:hypothetical protein